MPNHLHPFARAYGDAHYHLRTTANITHQAMAAHAQAHTDCDIAVRQPERMCMEKPAQIEIPCALIVAQAALGAPHVLSLMAQQAGFELRPVGVSGTNPVGQIAGLTRALADVTAQTLEALADGHITPTERATIADHIRDTHAALDRLAASLNVSGPHIVMV